MIRVILPVTLTIIGIGTGIGAGLLLEPDHVVADDYESENTTPNPPEEGSKTDTYGLSNTVDKSVNDSEFVKLNNQFIVPVLAAGKVSSLVVLSLSLEVTPETVDEIYRIEPKLRDIFLRVLFDHANTGGFDDNFTESSALQNLRDALTERATTLLGNSLRNVLIADIARQDTGG